MGGVLIFVLFIMLFLRQSQTTVISLKLNWLNYKFFLLLILAFFILLQQGQNLISTLFALNTPFEALLRVTTPFLQPIQTISLNFYEFFLLVGVFFKQLTTFLQAGPELNSVLTGFNKAPWGETIKNTSYTIYGTMQQVSITNLQPLYVLSCFYYILNCVVLYVKLSWSLGDLSLTLNNSILAYWRELSCYPSFNLIVIGYVWSQLLLYKIFFTLTLKLYILNLTQQLIFSTLVLKKTFWTIWFSLINKPNVIFTSNKLLSLNCIALELFTQFWWITIMVGLALILGILGCTLYLKGQK